MAPNKSKTKSARRDKSRKLENEVRMISAPISRGVVMKQLGPRQKIEQTNTGIMVSSTEKLTNVGTASLANSYAGTILAIAPFAPIWLSALSVCYSRYRWESLEVVYIPQCSTTTTGVGVEAFLYDSNDTGFPTVASGASIQGAVVHPLWAGSEGAMTLHANKTHPGCISAKCDLSGLRDFMPVITAATYLGLSTPDKNMYCKTYLLTATEGSTSVSTTVGALYLKYRISLRDPIPAIGNV